jgi:regulator of protease activity HflC (stomatin/prohibitin superfamily)
MLAATTKLGLLARFLAVLTAVLAVRTVLGDHAVAVGGFRLGRVLKKEKGPGLVLIFWPIDKIVKVSLRVVTWNVPAQRHHHP